MKTISQKELCYRALINEAIRLGKNCHEYESNIANRDKLINILNINVKSDSYGYYILEDYRIYVSCGIYGITGQMHHIAWIDNNNLHKSCYVYFTNINYNKD